MYRALSTLRRSDTILENPKYSKDGATIYTLWVSEFPLDSGKKESNAYKMLLRSFQNKED